MHLPLRWFASSASAGLHLQLGEPCIFRSGWFASSAWGIPTTPKHTDLGMLGGGVQRNQSGIYFQTLWQYWDNFGQAKQFNVVRELLSMSPCSIYGTPMGR